MSNTEHFYFALEWLLRRSFLGEEPRIFAWAQAHPDLVDEILCDREDLPPPLQALWSLYNLHPHTDRMVAGMCRGILARYGQARERFTPIPEPPIPSLLLGQASWGESRACLAEEVRLSAETFRARNFIHNLVGRACA